MCRNVAHVCKYYVHNVSNMYKNLNYVMGISQSTVHSLFSDIKIFIVWEYNIRT